jgi:alkanesulfonate monooxygenase SsuD/methylene tetrahydromethanopterin reductase-like flavin-dependent oxidoreductase (luciferase family)
MTASPQASLHQVRLGAHVGQQNMSMKSMRQTWRELDAHVDWISAWDHLYEAPPQGGILDHHETVATLAALATTTERAAIGVLVMYVGYRSPGVIAKAASTLDHLSDGRFELGLGAGWHEQECNAFGYPFPSAGTRIDMLDEATTIVRGLLTQDRTTFHGKHFQVENCSALPAPVQERLPIWIGGIGEKKMLRLIARHADGWNCAYISVDEFERLNGVLDGWCETEGTNPTQIRRGINLSFNVKTTAKAAAEEEERLKAQWGSGYGRIAGGSLLGTPDTVVARVLAYIKAGATDVNIALRAPWDPDALNVYLTEVLPAVKAELKK